MTTLPLTTPALRDGPGATDPALFRDRRAAAASRDGADARARFESALGRHQAKAGESPEALARRSAESFVAMTFVQPLLKSLREGSTAAPPFAPTQGERQFQGLADAETAQRIVAKSGWPLVDRITQDLLRHARRAGVAAPNEPATGNPRP